MRVVEYLKSIRTLGGLSLSEVLETLEAEHGVKAKTYPDLGLVLLNYNMIEAKKDNKIACECRSLVLDFDYNVVSRGFDRFFNYEEKKPPHKLSELIAHEKIDGSLITVFYHGGTWLYRTRGVIMPEQEVMGFDTTWAELVEETIMSKGVHGFETDTSYIFEMVSPYNRVVVKHDRPLAYFLSARRKDGPYMGFLNKQEWPKPRMFKFETYEDCLKAAKELPNLEEGYVMYNNSGAPVSKIKNPAYVAAHHLKGEGFSKRRVMELVRSGEDKEYLAIFPEDQDFFAPFQTAWAKLVESSLSTWLEFRDIADRKTFAMSVKDLPVGPLMFRMRGMEKPAVLEAMGGMTENAKNAMFEKFLELSDKHREKLLD